MLDKYDEEEQEQGMQIDASGAVEDAKRKRQEEIRARLKAGVLPAVDPLRCHVVVTADRLLP